MIPSISNNINFMGYNPLSGLNFTANRAQGCKIIPFPKTDYSTDVEQEIPSIASARLLNTMPAVTKEAKILAQKRDNMKKEAYELFEAFRFAQMLDYTDYMDEDNISVTSYNSPYGYTTSVEHYDDNHILLSTAKYRGGELDEYTIMDKNGIPAVEYEIMPSYSKGEDFSYIHINKKDRNVFGDIDLTLEIRNGRLVSIKSDHDFYFEDDLEESYDSKLYFSSFDGRPIRYEEGFKLFKDGKMQIDKVLKERSLLINFTQLPNGDERTDKVLFFHRNNSNRHQNIASFTIGFKRFENGVQSISESIDFKEKGIIENYKRNFVLNGQGKCISGDEYTFKNGIWHREKH